MRSTFNLDACETERLQETYLPELIVPKFTTSDFKIFMDNFKPSASRVDVIHEVPIN